MEIQMTIGFPTNTVILILAAMTGIAASTWLSLSQALRRLSVAPRLRYAWYWGAAILLIVWFLVRVALAVKPPDGVVIGTPFVIAFLGFGLAAGILPLLFSPVFRQIVRAIPQTWLVGIHAVRVFGFLFLALTDMNLLPAQFALPAGYGDILAGLLALVVVYALTRGRPYARAFFVSWHAFGLLDLIVALATGIIFIGPFAAQIAMSGASIHYLNYVLIVPTFGVPLLALLHIYSLFQMFSAPVENTEPGFQTSILSAGR
jgi:hypothetical protein